MEESALRYMCKELGVTPARDITWIVEPRHYNYNITVPAYGNEPRVEVFYAAGAVILTIPAADGEERRELLTKSVVDAVLAAKAAQ